MSLMPHDAVKNISTGAIVPILAAILPFVAMQFFDSPQLHGVFSADVFFLLLLLALPHGKILWKMPFVVAAAVFAIVSNSVDAYTVLGVYLLMIFASAVIPRKRKFLMPIFGAFSLLFFVADCGNFFYSTFVLTLPDVWGLAKFYWWGPILFFAVPLFQISLEFLFARKILWGANRLELSHVSVFAIMAISLLLNFGINRLQQRQPIMDFAAQKWFWQLCTPGIIGQNPYLQEDIKAVFPVWRHGKTVVDDYAHGTVMVLVESYGVNKSLAYTDSLLSPFDGTNAQFRGLYPRDAGHTQGAEWEDFLAPGGTVRDTPLPQRFKDGGLQTWYIHGYNGDFYEREANYAKFGFDSLLFRGDFKSRGLSSCQYGFRGICDSSIIGFLDSVLADSVPKFIYWTTLDAHPPYELASLAEKSSVCRSLSLSNVDCTYFTLQQNTMRHVASLASRHPDYRFVVRGDHRPMGSLEQSDFVQSFYFRWVPLVILNGTVLP